MQGGVRKSTADTGEKIVPKEYTPEDLVAIWEEFLGGQEMRHNVNAIADFYPT